MTPDEILRRIPQQPPFRFIDRIVAVDDGRIEGEHTFDPDAWFYRGHFPGDPVTPGVILLETLCQTGLVAFGLHLLSLEGPVDDRLVTLFTDAEVEFEAMVPPGESVRIAAERIAWRRRKLVVNATLTRSDGVVAARGTVAGMGVLRSGGERSKGRVSRAGIAGAASRVRARGELP
ncbi:MAG TPA: 3-hydroxyacyl-ACP dehydratase FabZ family protein [Vulgatibacter sp.]